MRGLIYAGVLALSASVCVAGEEKSELLPGDRAPAMSVTSWVQGEAFSGFDSDHVYVLDFWATWCGPCIAAMPHLTKVQEEYGDKVTVVAVNIWERVDPSDREAFVRAKVEQLGEKMGVRVAIDGEETMTNSWFKAAGLEGIPATFIVSDSKVAWIGHPMEMDEPLESVVAGTFDMNESRRAFVDQREKQAADRERYKEIQRALASGDGEAFAAAVTEHWDEFVSEHPGLLNMVAWEMATNERFEDRDMALAKKAAKLGCEKTEWKDAAIIDTYARVLYETGDLDGAIKYQKKAVKALGDDQDSDLARDLRASLKKYENELIPG